MARYHIAKSGMPETCHAKQKPCPLGGKHFESLAEANIYSQYLLESEFIDIDDKESNNVPIRTLDGFTIAQETYHDKTSTEYHETKFEKMTRMLEAAGYGKTTGTKKEKRRGLESETFMSFEYARDMELDNAMVIGKHGETFKLTGETELTPEEMNIYSTSKRNILNKIRQYRPDMTRDPLIKSIYYSNDGMKTVVQMGSPNMPDIAIIENNNVKLLEAKDLSSQGSQIDSTTTEVGEHGLPTMDTSNMPTVIKNNMKRAGFGKTIGTNYVLDDVNYHEGLKYFISNQQNQGVSALTFIGRDNKVHEIDITKHPDKVADKMTEYGIHATLVVRSNEIVNKPSQATLSRWKKTRGKQYFKKGSFPDDRYVPLSSFNLSNNSQLSIMKGKLCMGEMMLPIEMKDVKDLRNIDKTMLVDMNKVKARQMTFTGHLFQDTKEEREVTYNDRT